MKKQNFISRRDFLKTTLVGAAALLPASAALASEAAAAAPARIQSDLVILTPGWPLTPLPTEEEIAADPSRAGYAEALQQWMDDNPGVSFQTVEVNIWDQQAITTAIAGGVAPTYIFPTSLGGWSNAGARAAFAQGLMADVTPAIEKYGLRDKLIEGIKAAWEPITNVNGQYMGYPIDAGAQMYYIRRDLINELGLEEPSMNWTWDDLFTLAAGLTSEADGRKGFGNEAWITGNVLNDNGFELLSTIPAPETGWNWTRDASDPMWGELLAKYRKMIFEDNAFYSDVSYTGDNYTNAFRNSTIAMRQANILGAQGSAAIETSLASLAAELGKPYEEVFMFRPLPRGQNGYFINPVYVGNVSISPDTSAELVEVSLGAVDYMFLGDGWDIQKAGQYEASQDLQAVFNYPLPIDGKYTYNGVPGTFADAWGQVTQDDILAAVSIPQEPDMALYFPVEGNPGPDNQPFDDAFANLTYVADGVDPAAEIQKAADTWNSQASGFTSSVSDDDFRSSAQTYFQAIDAFWAEASPEFYETTFRPWYENKVLPAIGG